MDRPRIEDSYPLLPLQQGMLFNHLYAPDSGVDIVQVVCAFHEDLQVDMFQRAWQHVVARHAVLRTAFRWAGVAEPIQEIHAQVDLPFVMHDWRDRAPGAWRAELEAYIRADRLRGFELTEAPLLRLSVFQIDAADYRCVLTFHHIILDGRSLLLLIQEAFADYEAQRRYQALAPSQPRPYRDYIEWVRQRDTSSAELFWKNLLKGFTAPTALTLDRPPARSSGAPAGYADHETQLSLELTTTLKQLAQQHDLTLNTLIQGAWALLLASYSDQDDVVFGATRSCRRATMDSVDAMVGLFINTLPVRARMSPEMPLLAWLKELRSQNVAVRDYQHTPLAQVQQWSEISTGAPLFESIVVFENFLLHSKLRAQGGGWNNREVELRRQPNYPLSLCVFAEPQLIVKIVYDQARFDAATIERMLGHFTTLLGAMVAQPEARLDALSLLTPAERAQLLPRVVAGESDPPLVAELVATWAARTPAALAVRCGAEQRSYQELTTQANQLAH
ncbi:MAG TPA: condensation domain-containing protein, partial [Herpetosiphonaceae bacterium]